LSSLWFYALTMSDKYFTFYNVASEMANHIATSVGPSGPNIDYFLNLYKALEVMKEEVADTESHDIIDPHLAALRAHLP